MSNFTVIFKRELKAYFHSPIAYAVIFIFLIVAGFFFYSGMYFFSAASFERTRTMQMGGVAELDMSDFVLRPLFGNLSVVMLLMMPLFTMRLFSEEKKTGSIEFLFTWPIKDVELVIGKYLATLTIFTLMLSLTAPYLGFIAYYSNPHWPTVLAGYLGLLLLGASFMAIGVLMSTLTENQIISAGLTLAALLVFWVMGWTATGQSGTVNEIVGYISILKHFDTFAQGILDTRDIIYYISFIFVFLFFTLRSLESKKWRG